MQWCQRRWFLALLLLASLIPLVCPSIPPLVDLPGHMGRYQVELHPNDPELARFYSFHWQLIGNLGCDLLIIPFAKLFGIELGTKLIVMGIVALTVTGMLWIAREIHGEVPPTALFALPLAYGHPFIFGFVNYCLAMGLALCAFALWLRLGRLERFKMRVVLFIGLAPLIWLAHIYGWAVLCLLCGSAELVVQWARADGAALQKLWRTVWQTALNTLCLTPPLLLMLLWRTGKVAGTTGDWFDWFAKLLYAIQSLRDRWVAFDLLTLDIVLSLIAAVALLLIIRLALHLLRIKRLALFQNPRLGFAPALGLGATVLLLAFIFMPRVLLGSAYADMRLTPYVLAIALLAIRVNPVASKCLQQWLALAGLLFFGARTTGTTLSFNQSAQDYGRALGALVYVPQGARLVSFVGRERCSPWHSNRMEHLPALAVVRRNAFSNDQWDMAGAQLLTSHYPTGTRYTNYFRSDPSQMIFEHPCRQEFWTTPDYALTHFPRDQFDYVWLLDPPVYDPKDVNGMTKIWANGNDALYRVNR